MAFVVARRDGRWEIREAVSTAAGPRARTLATFRILTAEVAAAAARRAFRPTTPTQILDAARRAGAPVAGSAADAAAARLLRELDAGSRLTERLRRAVADRLGPAPPLPEQARQTAPWAAATPAERGEALYELLLLADALPFSDRDATPRMPRLETR